MYNVDSWSVYALNIAYNPKLASINVLMVLVTNVNVDLSTNQHVLKYFIRSWQSNTLVIRVVHRWLLALLKHSVIPFSIFWNILDLLRRTNQEHIWHWFIKYVHCIRSAEKLRGLSQTNVDVLSMVFLYYRIIQNMAWQGYNIITSRVLT